MEVTFTFEEQHVIFQDDPNPLVAKILMLKGEKGDPYTLTNEDKAAIVADVIEALPSAEGVSF